MRKILYTFAGLPFFIGAPLTTIAEQICESEHVLARTGKIVVKPSGADDTANIQCALEYATETGKTLVRLRAGSYLVGPISVDGFQGTLQGAGVDKSVISIADHSVDCKNGVSGPQARTSAAIKFRGGRIALREMTLVSHTPCQQTDYRTVMAVLHFTGLTEASEKCPVGLIDATVDSVRIRGNSPWGIGAEVKPYFEYGILASGEGGIGSQEGCWTLNGRLLVSRVEVDGYDSAIRASLQSVRSLLDVANSSFRNSRNAIYLQNALQTTVIRNSSFVVQTAGSAIASFTGNYEPAGSATIIVDKNEFEYSNSGGVAISLSDYRNLPGKLRDRRSLASVTGNAFVLSGDHQGQTGVMTVVGIDNGLFATNTLRGPWVDGLTFSDANNWSISKNVGFGGDFSAYNQIDFSFGAVDSIVGPGQSAKVYDPNNLNHVIEPQ
jgi:hypothetical protein